MCGIAGLVHWSGLGPAERQRGAEMAATLRHRGPDAVGCYADDCASLGHTRLSIIDLDAGHQPMSNEDGSVITVFNGEIYNHRHLAERLRRQGHVLRTRCDTEVIVHLYEEHGEGFAEHLNGMFAIALWDTRRRKLLLVRDRIGIKPLYWHARGNRIAFGSELKAVLAAGSIDRRVAPDAVVDYFTFGHVPAPRTILQDIHKLEPGHMVRCTPDGIAVKRWWDVLLASGENDEQSDEAWTDRFAELLEDAVGQRLTSDVPLGAFLSGGIDSASVAAAMARQSPERVLTQTVGFDEHHCDERSAARAVARALGTDHHEVMVRPDAVASAERLVCHFDEPFADACAIPMLLLSQAARQRVTVALAGDGADEMLAGYRRYRFDLAEARARSLCPRWLRWPTMGMASWLYPKADWLPRPLRAKATLRNLACDDITGHLRSVSLSGGLLPTMLLNADTLTATLDHDPYARGRALFERYPEAGLLNRLLYVDFKTLLPDDMLTKVDRASMAVGLEVRVPLLDHRVVELAASMPARLKLRGREHKRVLRAVVRRWLSDSSADRPKQGFNVPMDDWFRGPLKEMTHDTLMSPGNRSCEWVESRAIRRVMADHQRGLRANGHVLWTLLMLELWAREFGPPPRLDAEAANDGQTVTRRELAECAS